MKLEISYKNSVIGSLSEGESIALHLNGSKLTEDLVVRAVNVNLIQFTIDGTTYQAEEGMTWAEWVADTTYNTGGFYISNADEAILIGGLAVKDNVDDVGILTMASKVIVEGRAYDLEEYNHGGGNNE